MDEHTLLPCPFCGGPVSFAYTGSHDWTFDCASSHRECGASTTFYISHEGDEQARAIKAWNTRATQPTGRKDE